MELRQLLLFTLLSTSLSQYCTSGPYSAYDTNLVGASVQGDTNVTDTAASCPGTIGVKNLTNLVAELTVGKNYTVTYQTYSCGSQYPVRSTAWIDYNANFKYDSYEQLFPSSTVYGLQTWRFTVPDTALLGNTRIRIQAQEYGVDPLDPCSAFNYGGTTDFAVNIKTASPQYCVSGPTTGNDMNLGPVQLNGFTLNINDATNCPSYIGPRDLTDLIADVNPGSSYTLHYQVTDCDPTSPPWQTLSGAWIDYNQDGFFSDWERVGVSQQTSTADVALTFKVPVNSVNEEVIPGNTLMRVQVQETNAEDLDPCAHFAWGGTKDFTIRILEPKSYCSSGPTSTGATALGDVKLTGATTSINDHATCADASVGPVDHTSMVADVFITQPYTLTYNVIGCPSQFPTMSAAWVDYNQNEVLESWEQITPRSNAFGTISYSFKVPPTSPNQVVVGGPTRLRVQVQQTSANQTLDPCAMFTNGGTKDYTLSILNSTSTSKYGGRNHYTRISNQAGF